MQALRDLEKSDNAQMDRETKAGPRQKSKFGYHGVPLPLIARHESSLHVALAKGK